MQSVRRQAICKTLANLPYRTIEIDTVSAKVRNNRFSSRSTYASIQETEDDHDKTTNDESFDHLNLEFTSSGAHIDVWNRADDVTFCPYVLRNELNKQNRTKKNLLAKYNASTATVVSGYDNSDAESMESGADAPGPTIRSRVSFNHMIEVLPHAEGDGDDDDDQVMDSTMTSLTMTPNISKPRMSQTSMVSKQTKSRIFFVCFHLPVILTRDKQTKEWNACWSESLLAATDGSKVVNEYDCHWIGTVSCNVSSEEEKDEVRAVLSKMKCTPLFFDKKVHDDHYYGMCKQVLWPAFHNIDLLDLSGSFSTDDIDLVKPEGAYQLSDWDQSRLQIWWKAYVSVNTAFAEALASMLKPGDIMWVHDYHLSLLPKLVDDKEQVKNNGKSFTKKVFLLHIPFPTSQVFRELECGEAILEGMLHADLVGFHAFDHARHFLKAAKRIFGLNYESLIGGLIGVQLGRRTVLVTMHNVSIEPSMVNGKLKVLLMVIFIVDQFINLFFIIAHTLAAMNMPSVIEGATKLRHNHTTRKIIAGVDIAQRLSGIALKLLAFERLLNDYPIWQQNVVMIQKCLVPGSRHDDEARTLQEVRYLVKRIKEKFGPHVIDCEEIAGSSLPIDQRISLWKVADLLMVTPIREGLNLLPLEFVFTKKKPLPPGVIISSEFSAVASVLNGALRVNPYDIQVSSY